MLVWAGLIVLGTTIIIELLTKTTPSVIVMHHGLASMVTEVYGSIPMFYSEYFLNRVLCDGLHITHKPNLIKVIEC